MKRTLSKHLKHEITYAVTSGHQPGDPPPLAEGDPVPGCDCESCTGVPADADAPAGRRARPGRDRDALPVEEARRVPIKDVCRRLGLGDPQGRWGEPRVLCPFHDDTNPSLRLNVAEGLWFCDPCARGGDGIELYRRVRGVPFAEAVKELAHV